MLYLQKANDDLISHCRCCEALISVPGQLDCPWCGCGWLFSCLHCRKAFTFAQVVDIDRSMESLVRESNHRSGFGEMDDEEARELTGMMETFLERIEGGKLYVYLDGAVIPSDAPRVRLAGMHSYHDLDSVPQVAALSDRSVIDGLLSNRDYWLSTAEDD